MSMTSPVLQQIRDQCRRVAEQAEYVRIDQRRLQEYAPTLPLAAARAPQLDPQRHYLEGGPETTVAFFLTLDSINFGSGYFPHLQKRPGMSGYFTIASSLTDQYRRGGPWSAPQLAALTIDECAAMLGQEHDDGPRTELMAMFAKALNDLGEFVLRRFDGSFTGLVSAADHSAERLVRTLGEMPFFRDVQRYRGFDVPFFRRAQIAAADLWIALGGAGYGRCDDLDQLTMFADNLVPHVLRMDGVLVYHELLAAYVDAEKLLCAHSPEEIEIRACAVHAVELMAAALRAQGHAITPMGLDYLLWHRGQQPHYKAHPRHRARTVFY